MSCAEPVQFAVRPARWRVSRSQIENVASRTGAKALIVPHSVDGAEGVDDYFDLVDQWVSRLAEAFAGQAGRRD